jgi:hypothetical protein
MLRISLLALILQLCQGCTTKQLFDPDQTLEIAVRPNDHNSQTKVTKIRDKERIESILAIINESSEEVIKFYPRWHVTIVHLSGKEHLVMCSENQIKYGGKTYRLARDIKGALFN